MSKNSNDVALKDVMEKEKVVRGIMEQNIRKAVERGMQIDEIELKSIQLQEDADRFHTGTQRVQRHFCRRHYIGVCLISCMVAFLLAIILYFILR